MDTRKNNAYATRGALVAQDPEARVEWAGLRPTLASSQLIHLEQLNKEEQSEHSSNVFPASVTTFVFMQLNIPLNY